MHLASAILFLTVATVLNGNVVLGDIDRDQSVCHKSYRACLRNLDQDVAFSTRRSQFLQQGIRAVCRTLEQVVDCMDEATGTSKCKRYASRMTGHTEIVKIYDFICENQIEDIEDNWQCVVDVLEPSLRCVNRNSCNFKAATACTDLAVSRSSKCHTDAQGLIQTLIRKYMVIFSGCTEEKKECQFPANHCLQAFNGLDIFESKRVLNMSFNNICSGFLNDIQCFRELVDRADCGFFPQTYFAGSYTAFVKLFSYVCEDRKADIDRNWNCLKVIGKDMIRCTGAHGPACQSVHEATQCANNLIRHHRQCGLEVKPLVKELIEEKMTLFNRCAERRS